MNNTEPIDQESSEQSQPRLADCLQAADDTQRGVLNRLKGAPGKVVQVLKAWGTGPVLSAVGLTVLLSSGCGNTKEPLPVSPSTQESIQQTEEKIKNTHLALIQKIKEDAETSGVPYFATVKDSEGNEVLLFPISTSGRNYLGSGARFFPMLTPDGLKTVYVQGGNSIDNYMKGMRDDMQNNKDRKDSSSPSTTFGLKGGALTYTKNDGTVKNIGEVLDGIYDSSLAIEKKPVTDDNEINELFARVIKESKEGTWNQEILDNETSLTKKAELELITAESLSKTIGSLLSPTPIPLPTNTSELAKSPSVQ